MNRRIGWAGAWIALVTLAECGALSQQGPLSESLMEGMKLREVGELYRSYQVMAGKPPRRSRTSIRSVMPAPGAPTARSGAARSSCGGRPPSPTPRWNPPPRVRRGARLLEDGPRQRRPGVDARPPHPADDRRGIQIRLPGRDRGTGSREGAVDHAEHRRRSASRPGGLAS